MKLEINNKIYDLNDFYYLGEGKEGESYKFSNKVVKILDKYPKKIYLTEDDVLRLKDLKTEVLDHPIDSAKENDTYLGPVSPYISSSGYYNFTTISSKDFINTIDKMLSDSKKYALINYMISDLQYEDSIFDQKGNLHLVDSGSYSYEPNLDYKELEKINKREIDTYLLEEVIDNLLRLRKVDSKKREIIKESLRENALEYDGISEFLKEEVANYSSLNDYVGKLRK